MSFPSFKLLVRKPLFWLYTGGAVLLVAALLLWCFVVSVQPERVFWRTIERGLASHGVTVTSEEPLGASKMTQILHYSLGASNLSRAITTLEQQGTTVKSEVLGTPTTDYTRYLDIKTDQKRQDGSEMDFSKVIGVWAKGPEGTNRLLQQAVLGTGLPLRGMGIPIGYVGPQARAKLIEQMHSDTAYQVAFDKVEKKREHGRLVYVYEVTLQPVAYAGLIKRFAQSVGLHGLDQLDPQAFKGQPGVKMKMSVDVRAQQVTSIALTEGDAKQTYSSYDVPVTTEVPKQTITASEMQQRLSNLQ